MKRIDRREFIKLMGMAGLTAVTPWPLARAHAQLDTAYTGPIFISIAASGGWDPTSFCDPKENVPGQPEINRWSRSLDTQTIPGSPITYAPFANNQQFFERFHNDMLVINGVDSQTNSHDTGVRFNWSGRMPMGYPSFAAIAAAVLGEGLPLPFLTNASYRETAGLVSYTEVRNTRDLQDLVNVNRVPRRDRSYFDEDERAIIESYQVERVAGQLGRSDLLPRQRRALENLDSARSSRSELQALLLELPDNLVNPVDQDGNRNDLLQQAQLALICCDAGLTVSADLQIGGFDTHQNHDANHRESLQRLTNGITYLWDTAEAMGLADRLHVLVGSDFGRTPRYNDGAGKDHWPVGSALIMKQNAPWANRVVGYSDGGHNASPMNPFTLQEDTTGAGITLTPAHVQDAFRQLAGIDQHAVTRRFPLEAEWVDYFSGTV